MTTFLLLVGIPLGLGLGFIGTFTGIGGGFLLLPVLALCLPAENPSGLALATLTIVVLNSSLGTWGAFRTGRLRWVTGLSYGALTLPAVMGGTIFQARVDRHQFEFALGLLLVLSSVILLFPRQEAREAPKASASRWWLGAGLSVVIGLLSGFFGLGGGFLFLPLLVLGLRLPTGEAVATTQLIVGLGSWEAWLLQIGHTSLPVAPMLMAGLMAGVLLGSPLGSWAVQRAPANLILATVGILMAAVGLVFLFRT